MEVLKDLPLDFSRGCSTKKEKEKANQILAELAEEAYGLDAFCLIEGLTKPSISLNNRITTTQGRFYPSRNSVEISGYLLKACMLINDFDAVRGTLRHELAHWYLFSLKKDYNDGQREFEELLTEVDAPSSGATNKKLRLSRETPFLGYMFEVSCDKCDFKDYSTTRCGKYRHKNCGGHLIDNKMALVKEDWKD